MLGPAGLWEPEGVYLNTASYGLPPRPAWEALQAALADWHGGRTSWEHWDEATERSRELWARMVGVATERVAVAANVSSLVGLVVSALPEGTRVVAPDVDFSSLVWPFVARGLDVRTVLLSDLAEAVDAETDVVAFKIGRASCRERV